VIAPADRDSSAEVYKPADTALMRAIAALLIANSHLELFYPRAWLAGDGLLGNALFYFLSGFGVALGARSRPRGFFPWFGRRIVRIYPSVIIAALIIFVILQHDWKTYTFRSYLYLLWPTPWGFVGHVMILYIVLYWMLKFPYKLLHILVVLAIAIAYIISYCTYVPTMSATEPLSLGRARYDVHTLYFSGIMLLGGLLAPIIHRPGRTAIRDGTLLIVTFAAYVVIKFAMVHGYYPRWFIVLHILTLAICLMILRVSATDDLQEFLARVRPIGWFVALLAGITLEMYIMQGSVQEIPGLVTLRFPLNLAGFWLICIPSAVLLHKAGNALRSSIMPSA
jgi:hypothetical protein